MARRSLRCHRRREASPPPFSALFSSPEDIFEGRTRRFARRILMNSPSHLVFQRCESLRQKGGGAGSRGGRGGWRWRRRRRERRWSGPEPEMAARWLLLALLAAHAAALPDIIRIGEYLSSLYLLELKGSLSLSLSLSPFLFSLCSHASSSSLFNCAPFYIRASRFSPSILRNEILKSIRFFDRRRSRSIKDFHHDRVCPLVASYYG